MFDNCDQPKAFEGPGIDKYLPAAGGAGQIIFTSRNPECERLGITIQLSQMTEKESLDLLLLQSKNERTDKSVTAGQEIVMKLGYLPLAIDQAAAYISARKLPLVNFIKYYNKRKETVLKTTPSFWEYRKKLGDRQAETSLSVFTTFELSFSQVGRSKEEKQFIERILTLSAFLYEADVSEKLFRAFYHAMDGPWDHYLFEDRMTDASSLSLVQIRQDQASELHLSLHVLVAEWLRLRAKNKKEIILEAANILAAFLKVEDPDGMSFLARESIILHIDSWVERDKEFLMGMQDPSLEYLNYAAMEFAKCFRAAGRYSDAETMAIRALNSSERAYGPEKPIALLACTTLAEVYDVRKEWEDAEKLYRWILAGYTKLNGPDHEFTLATIGNLGNLYFHQGKLEPAKELFILAIAGFRKKIDQSTKYDDQVVTNQLNMMHNLGTVYVLQEKFDEAETWLQAALEVRENGQKRGLHLLTRLKLAEIYLKQERFDEAEKMCKPLLDNEINASIPDPEVMILSSNELGEIYFKWGKLDQAEISYERALRFKEKQLGKDNESTLETVNDLGNIYHKEEKLDKAEEMYCRAVEGYDKTLGPDHQTTLCAVNNLAQVYLERGNTPAAVAMFERALKVEEKQVGRSNGRTLDKVKHLRDLYQEQGEEAKLKNMENWLREAGCVEEELTGDVQKEQRQCDEALGSCSANGELAT